MSQQNNNCYYAISFLNEYFNGKKKKADTNNYNV